MTGFDVCEVMISTLNCHKFIVPNYEMLHCSQQCKPYNYPLQANKIPF